MVVSIEPFIRDPWVKGRSESDMMKILIAVVVLVL